MGGIHHNSGCRESGYAGGQPGGGGTDRRHSQGVPTPDYALDDAALLARCRRDAMRSGGPGGQHMQKTASAVRLVHTASGVEASCADERDRIRNEALALRHLRLRLALTLRGQADPAWLAPFRQGRRLTLRDRSPSYPLAVAVVMDALAQAQGSPAVAAESLDLSTSQVVRLLAADKEVFAAANRLRAECGLGALHG